MKALLQVINENSKPQKPWVAVTIVGLYKY